MALEPAAPASTERTVDEVGHVPLGKTVVETLAQPHDQTLDPPGADSIPSEVAAPARSVAAAARRNVDVVVRFAEQGKPRLQDGLTELAME